MTPWLSVVIPTAGKRHAGLLRAIDSVRMQGYPIEQVEVLVIADTHGTPDRATLEVQRLDVADTPRACRWAEWDGGTNCFGQPQRTYGSRIAKGDWVAYLQDDDIASQDALEHIWTAIHKQVKRRPLFFKVQMWWGESVWRNESLYQGNIDANCLVFPRAFAREVEWGLRYEGDFDAAVQAMQCYSGDVGWCQDTIAIARPGQTWWQ